MTTSSPQGLQERIARLKPEQVVKLVTGLQQRIDALRAGQAERHDAELIAVIGLGCRFPGAASAAEFFDLLEGGVHAVGAAPASRPEREPLPPGGYIEAIECFDAAFFGLRDSEAAQMDPQHRLALEVAWHALEDAGLAEAARRPRNSGIFLGISTHDYAARFHGSEAGFTPLAATGNSASAAAGRLAHWLDITGPALAVDTACSSSLVAVHTACRSLQAGECDMALAGGVNALISDELTRGFAAAGMLSPTYACHTFDANADGYVRGEGAGFVVLKRLSDALRDGDHVRAVIRGGAVNHDGRASSLTAPNASAQAALISAALADAGLAPGDVQVVECHGTGTPLGDPIEVQALAQAYGRERHHPLLLGAVKTNIGHLEAAAGIAGLIKLVLSLQAGRLPPTLHQTAPNPRVDWDALPIRVIDCEQSWPQAEQRRAGVSSFGFSGTNAHLILEAAPEAKAETASAPAMRAPFVLPFSAPDQEGLARLAGELAKWVGQDKLDLQRAVVTYALGRPHHALRAAVAGDDAAALAAGLQDIAAGHDPVLGARGAVVSDRPRLAFMFTGQGSQWTGMGKDLYETDPVFRQAVDRCAGIVTPLIGCSLTELMFQEPSPGMSLSDTRLAQPALFTLEYALAERLASWGIVPDVMIGHSLGEWVAACRAGVFSLDDALRLVVERGRLMASAAQEGAMAAVFAPPSCLAQLPDELAASVDLAAVNAPDECVISGRAQVVRQACEALENLGLGTQLLRTSHAFHSRLMEPVLDAFASAVSEVSLSPPAMTLVSNLTGTAHAAFDTVDYWVSHIRQPVRFADGVATLAAMKVDVLVEIGASPNLIGTAGRCPAFQEAAPVLAPTLRRNQPAGRTLGQLLARLYVAGLPLDWVAIYGKHPRMDVPGYPFERCRHWAEPAARVVQADSARPTSPRATEPEAAPEASAKTSQDLAADVAQFLVRTLQLPESERDSDRSFLEMGVDSLALTEAVAALERKWSIAIPRRALFETLGTPARLIAHVLAESAHTLPPAADRKPTSVAVAAPARQTVAANPAPAAPAQTQALSADQQAGLAQFSQAYVQRSRASREQRSKFGAYLADSRAVAGFRPETKGMLYPIVGSRAQGSHMFDVDGNRYVDIAMGFGVQLFGHSPAFIAEAISRHIGERGLFIGPQAHLAGEVAQRLCRLTGNERAAFCNSGTEAVMTALRLARHATGRKKVAMFQGSYHGHFDGVLAQPGADGAALPMAGGTPQGMADDIVLLDYGDEAGSLEVLAELGDTLAAVLVEPVQGRRPDRQPRDFLQKLRELTHTSGTALIFDEVLLGFRVALGGAQAWAGVQADLVTYGKIVGGGLPIGVVAGRATYLDALDGGPWPLDGEGEPRGERTFFAGTFNKNPLAMAAALAVLKYLEDAGPGLQQALNQRTQDFAARLNTLLNAEDCGISVHAFSSLFRFVGASDLFYNAMIQHGVYVWEGRTCFLSTAHSDDDLQHIENAVRASLRSLRACGMLRAAGLASPALHAALAPPTEALPATAGQRALRLLAAFSPQASAAYNQSLIFSFHGPLNTQVLRSALRELCARHEALRTTFPEDGATQIIHRELAPELSSMHGLPDEQAFQQWLNNAVLTPIDLERGPMLRAWIIAQEPDRHRLVLAMPHLIVDGWSLQLIALELAELYSAGVEGRPAILDEAVQYRRYAEYARLQEHDVEAANYWRTVYDTQPPVLDLPADRARPALQSYAGARARCHAPVSVRSALEALGRQTGSSLFSICLAAYARLLSELSGQRDMAVAIFSAGQPELGVSALVGYCVGVLPLRLRIDPAAPGTSFLAATQQAVTQGMARRNYPYAQLIKDLGLRRDPARPPLASVSFNLDRMDAAPSFAQLNTQVDANAHAAVRWDLNWNISSDVDGLHIDAYYNRDLFDAKRIQAWLARYVQILESLTGPPDGPPLQETEQRRTETLADMVAATAKLTPRATAVIDSLGKTDYAGLEAMASSLAARLAAMGVRRGDRVAFRLARGLGPVVAMLATMRLGAAFVPLDDEHPDEHHAFVLQDCAATAVVIDAGARGLSTSVATVEWQRGAAPAALHEPALRMPADATAYVLYTSGSTGRPKGVRVSHGAIAAYVPALLERLAIKGPLSFAMVSSFAADLGYTSLFGALWTGGVLHAIDAEAARDPAALQRWMANSPVDVLKIVPTHLAALLDTPESQTLLPKRALILGGDVLTWRLVDRIRALGAGCRIFNHYGPTETTVGACMTEALDGLREEGDHAVPVGPPLSGYDITLQDANGYPAAGQEGEIVIAGAAVALGYTNAEAAGRQRFGVSDAGQRFYRTGDLGRRRGDGAIVFVGRGDDMVKIRGHRIEPAGLAELLRTCAGVSDAIVLVEPREGREPALCAAVAGDVNGDEVLAWLADQVPAAMVPQRCVVCAALPLTSNGKVDRQALLSRAASQAPAGRTSEPRQEQEDAVLDIVCTLWRSVLQCDAVGPDDDFFALGGDSIMAIQIVGRARAQGLALTPAQVFQAPTPRALAQLAVPVREVAGRHALTDAVPLTPIQHWFMETPMTDRNHWCLTAVFALPVEPTLDRLRAAAAAVQARHDALRIGWTPVPQGIWQQLVPPLTPTVRIVEGRSLDAEALREAEDELADALMASIDLGQGKVLAMGATVVPGGQGRLVVAVHHAVFDMVSWSILADDLEAELLDHAAPAQPATTSWTWWSRALSERVGAAGDALPHWVEVAREAACATMLPVDAPQADNIEGQVREEQLMLDQALSSRFLAGMSAVFGLRPHEAVLAAVGLVLAEWAQGPLAWELEGHGREPFDPAIDLSRSIGWFTTRYPTVLPAHADLQAWVVAMKETLRKIPDHGLTYGLLRYGGHADLHAEPALSFNFVGEISQFGTQVMALQRLGAGTERAADAARRHVLAFDGWQQNGELMLSCRYAARHNRETIRALLERVRHMAQQLADACQGSAAAVYTPSDFTGMSFSQDELDDLLGQIVDPEGGTGHG